MKDKIASLGALMSATLASICCLGPAILISLGVGAGVAAELSKYRPIFLLITAVLLGVAFYLTYRQRQVQCTDGSCRMVSPGRGAKLFLWVVTFTAIGLIAKPYWSAFLSSKACCIVTPNTATK